MKAKELRDFSASDLQGRIKTWQEEVFRSRFKTEQAEARDTSIIRKLRRDIARANTILNEKRAKGETAGTATTASTAPAAEDKPAKAPKAAKPKAEKAPKAEAAADKPAKKKATKKEE
jgi:large subunit ribosomal protein L29